MVMMRKMGRVAAGAALAAVVGGGPASAHTGLGDGGGFAHGFMHPVGGADHVLAMVAVGLLATQLDGRARYLVPCAFLAAMVAGGALGMAGVGLPFVEMAIALSVVVIGAVVAVGAPVGIGFAAFLVAAFAVFHGHAHGAEMPAGASGFLYGAGFVAATACLHAAGFALGFALTRLAAAPVRIAGALASAAGVALLVQAG